MSIYSDFLTNKGRSIHKWLHYFPIYEKHFQRFVNQPVVFWEIGVDQGGSMQMWKRYLGPFATIIGIDILPKCKKYEEKQIHIRIGDQSDPVFLQSVLDEFGPPDVILDDGSHVMEHVCKTWNYLYSKVSKNGVYFIEDLHTAYWEDYGGGLKREGTFIELCKKLIDYEDAEYDLKLDEFEKITRNIAFYDGIVVFEKCLKPVTAISQGALQEQGNWALDFPVYSKYAGKFADRSVVFWGMGLSIASLEKWKAYLGSFATVVGMGNDEANSNYENEMIPFKHGNPLGISFLQSVRDEFGSPDIVLYSKDLGTDNICGLWEFLHGSIAKDGVFFIEKELSDQVNAENREKPENQFINHCKELIDSLNARWNGLPVGFAESTYVMDVYDNLIVMEKTTLPSENVYDLRIPDFKWYQMGSIVSFISKISKKIGLYRILRKFYYRIHYKQ